jgi:hypothetical protein
MPVGAKWKTNLRKPSARSNLPNKSAPSRVRGPSRRQIPKSACVREFALGIEVLERFSGLEEHLGSETRRAPSLTCKMKFYGL